MINFDFFIKSKKQKSEWMKKILTSEMFSKKFLVGHEVGQKKFCISMAIRDEKLKIFFQSMLTDVDMAKKNFKFLKSFT